MVGHAAGRSGQEIMGRMRSHDQRSNENGQGNKEKKEHRPPGRVRQQISPNRFMRKAPPPSVGVLQQMIGARTDHRRQWYGFRDSRSMYRRRDTIRGQCGTWYSVLVDRRLSSTTL